MLARVSTLWLVIGAGAPTLLAGQRPAAPDVIIVNGKVFTSDTTNPWVQAVAVRGNRISAVGTTAEVRALGDAHTRVIDVGGRVVVPGFNDAHDHVSAGTPGVVVATAVEGSEPSVSGIIDSVRAAAARVSASAWIQGTLGVATLNDTALRRAALDRAAPSNPVLLEMPSGHGMILNSAALRALRIADMEPDIFGGWYERDAAGRLTGRLDEYAGWNAIRRLRSLPPDSVSVANLRRYGERELRYGITSVQDMAHSWDAQTTVRLLTAARLPLRVHIFKYSIPTATSLETADWEQVSAHPAPNVTVRGRKWILDGTPIEGLALTRRPHGAPPGSYGRLDFPIDSMRSMLRAALTSREPLALHITGDSTAVIVLGLMESLATDSEWRPLRVRFEHGGALTPDLFPRAIAKGIVPVRNLQLLPPPVVSRNMPKVPLAAVVSPAMPGGLGSDGEPRSPFVGMYYAVSFPFEPRVSREMLVRFYTWGSAFAEGEEREKGTLGPGMLADLAVLSQDIFTVAADDLPKTESVLTMIDGRVVWDARVVRRPR